MHPSDCVLKFQFHMERINDSDIPLNVGMKKGRKFGGPVESHPIAQNENLVSSMRVQDLSDPYRNPCPSSTPPRRPTMRYPPLRLLQATILSECQGAQESLRHYQSPLLSHQKWCKL